MTGASSGLGRAIAGFLAEAGAGVVLVARREAELASAAADIQARGQRAAAVPGARMGHHPGRLVHDCQVGILKQDVERNWFVSDHSRTVRNEPDPVPGCNPGPG